MTNAHYISQSVYFFFQAEDGIRDATVTGVQTWLFRSCRPQPTEASPQGVRMRENGGRANQQDQSTWSRSLPPRCGYTSPPRSWTRCAAVSSSGLTMDLTLSSGRREEGALTPSAAGRLLLGSGAATPRSSGSCSPSSRA